MRTLAAAVLLAILSGGVSCARSDEAQRLPDIRLPTASAQEGPSLASCPTPKCLTAYVAPWCGYCRMGTPALIALRRFLGRHGVEMRFVVGKDRPDALREYAREFGPDTLLDADDSVALGGVPYFFVTDRSGAILKEVSGLPMGDYPIEELAAYFGLP